MADFSNVIQEINADINTNGVGAITGAKLNKILLDIVNSINDEKQDELTIDATPVLGSTNPVQSGGVAKALEVLVSVLSQKADKIPVEKTLPQDGMLPNVLYELGEISEDTTFVMANAKDNTIANVWIWTFDILSVTPTITWPQGINAWDGGYPPVITENFHYEVSVMDGVASFIEAPLP